MPHETIAVPYHPGLGALERVLAGVRRPGEFFAHGALELPMPRVEVEGIGVLSFPVPKAQARTLIRVAERAPYGRGEETIVDTSVRKVWQVTPDRVRVGGKSWERSLRQILDHVVHGLGAAGVPVTAALYKVLVYDPGSFFRAHRDTEKAPGMFATLIIVLPSAHRGGELVIRHAGREVALDLCSTEISDLTFAAFYADCEHEVRPVTEGYRVCLIYNLIQQPSGKPVERPLTAPLYDRQAAEVAAILRTAFTGTQAPAKLAWLLEHQYSPAELSFATLKNADLAVATVLREAAPAAGCAAHLGLVHIEEYGPAAPLYDTHWRPRWRGRYHDRDPVGDDGDQTFEVIEVSDGRRYVDHWKDAADRAMEVGELPLKDGEVLPAGALDGEPPDAQRLTEATGNEGASFERAYHRAAVVLWPRARFVEVLLQAGVGAAVPYLADRVDQLASSAAPDERQTVTAMAERVITAWQATPPHITYRDRAPRRADMIRLLERLGHAASLDRFLSDVVVAHYDGSENEALAAAIFTLDAGRAAGLLVSLAQANMPRVPNACAALLAALLRAHGRRPAPQWFETLRTFAATLVEALPGLAQRPPRTDGDPWWRTEKAEPIDAAMVADLLHGLAVLGKPALYEAAGAAITAPGLVFDPGTVVAPALVLLHDRGGRSASPDPVFERLWIHAADSLLARSEQPPEPPRDWRQTVQLDCRCEDCRALQKFALDPAAQTHRFRVRQDRRQHLHGQIERYRLDMTHVTERRGSPQTLVCTKTLAAFERRCAQHGRDLAALTELARIAGSAAVFASRRARIAAAKARAPRPFIAPPRLES